ncbi:hypothetical protein E4U17_004520 [Claviceps sp. LM77 group G4]|nr:hypothetical protein E4U17_004520 [Claviceps sp. LM77 group G4]
MDSDGRYPLGGAACSRPDILPRPTHISQPLVSYPSFYHPYSTGPSSHQTSLPPFDTFIFDTCPPAPTPRAANTADAGTYLGRHSFSILSEPRPPAPISRAANAAEAGTYPGRHSFSILSDPSPPAPISRAANAADTGTYPGRHYYSALSDPSPPATIPRKTESANIKTSVGLAHWNSPRYARKYFVPIDVKKGSTEAQLRRNLVARSSEVYRIKLDTKRKITEMEDKYKDEQAKTRALEEQLRQEREEAQRKDEALRRKDEEIERLKRGK